MDRTSSWASPSVMSLEVEYPWSSLVLPELADLSWMSMDMEQQLQLQGIGDLPSDHHQLGLESAIGPGTQVVYYPAHDYDTIASQFGDTDFVELLNGLSKQYPTSETNIHHENNNKSYPLVWNDAKETKQTNSNNKIKGCTKRRKQEAFPHILGVWGGRRRRHYRVRRTSWRIYMSSFKKHFSCQRRWKSTRKNNPHWTEDEVCMLLHGLSEYGVGSWTKIKKAYFGTSIRTAVHLKDKWKNLKEASGPKVRSKKKVQAQNSTQEILRRLEGQIIKIDKAHAAQERRAPRRKQLSRC